MASAKLRERKCCFPGNLHLESFCCRLAEIHRLDSLQPMRWARSSAFRAHRLLLHRRFVLAASFAPLFDNLSMPHTFRCLVARNSDGWRRYIPTLPSSHVPILHSTHLAVHFLLPNLILWKMPPARYPDEREHPWIQMTLDEFVADAGTLFAPLRDADLDFQELKEASLTFCKFVLAGRAQRDGVGRHISVNPCQALVIPRRYNITRDYDSLIGASWDLPYSKPLALFPVPPFRDTLRKSNHLNSRAYSPQVSTLSASLYPELIPG